MITTEPACPGRTPFSFELYPPKTLDGGVALARTVEHLAAAGPEFISVTFGAGGSSRTASLDVLRSIRTSTSVDPMAHLTCVGSTHAQASRLIKDFLDAGVYSFLALRGDPPAGAVEGDAFLGDLGSAAELVQLIGRVSAEHEPYAEGSLGGLPGAVQLGRRHRPRIAVAAFPNGHPRSRSTTQDLDTLLAKQAAGATLAITQLFFHADDYLAFAERARRHGVTMPILPGVMPITSPARLRRVLELSGEALPSDLAIALEVEPDEAGRIDIGTDYSARLIRDVVAGGAPGVHLYAFNQHRTVLDVLHRAGIPVQGGRPVRHPIPDPLTSKDAR